MALLKLGASGPDVQKLITDLAAAGFPPAGLPGNIFDREVLKAVKAFQSAGIGPDGLPLVVDGEAGPLTQFALDVANGRRLPPSLTTLPVPGLPGKPAGASVAGWNALQVANAEIKANAREIGGDNMGPFVEKYHGITGASVPDSWCASFISYCFATGNPGAMPYKPTAGARATLTAFKKKGWVYNASITNPPEPGDIIVWWRDSFDGWMGHIGLVAGYENGLVHTIEGNRGDYVSKVSHFHYKLGKIDKLLGFGRARP